MNLEVSSARLPLDRALDQSAHDLILEQYINDGNGHGPNNRTCGKDSPRLGEILGDEQVETHHQGELFRVAQQDIGDEELVETGDERQNPHHSQNGPHKGEDQMPECLPMRGSIHEGRFVNIARNRIKVLSL